MRYVKEREYWIVDPQKEKVSLINFEDSRKSGEYTYEDVIKSEVLDGFEIRIADFVEVF